MHDTRTGPFFGRRDGSRSERECSKLTANPTNCHNPLPSVESKVGGRFKYDRSIIVGHSPDAIQPHGDYPCDRVDNYLLVFNNDNTFTKGEIKLKFELQSPGKENISLRNSCMRSNDGSRLHLGERVFIQQNKSGFTVKGTQEYKVVKTWPALYKYEVQPVNGDGSTRESSRFEYRRNLLRVRPTFSSTSA